MKTPNTDPIKSTFKNAPMGKVIHHDETPHYLQKIMSQGRQEGQQAAQRHWNDAVDFFGNLAKGKDFTGNDYVSMMGTYITYFAGTWIILIKTMIANKDEAGIGFNDLIEPICAGIKELVINAKAKEINHGNETERPTGPQDS